MTTTVPSTPYVPRPVRPLDPLTFGGWRVKVYGISVKGEFPRADIVGAARELAVAELSRPRDDFADHGHAVLIAHEASDGNFALLSWWIDENMLRHRVFYAPPDRPLSFEDFSHTDIAVCVWELMALTAERNAWVEKVLANPAGPDLDAYWAFRFTGDV